MGQQELVKLDPDAMVYLQRIAKGVAVILWLMFTGILFWPIAAATASYGDMEITTSFVSITSVVLAGIAAYLICRLIFPVEYTTLQTEGQSGEVIDSDTKG